MSEEVKNEELNEEATEETVVENEATDTAEAEETSEAIEVEDAESEESGEEDKQGKKRFGKKNKKDPRDEKIEELTDRVKRQLAEFENFRNRTEKEKSSMYAMGAKAVVEKILPIIDSFERGLANVPEGSDDAFVDGMQRVYKQMCTELESIGVTPIEAVGKEFDPNIHNAVMQVESDEYESGIVAQEMLKGYMYKDTLVRPSMVAVVP